MTTDTAGDDDFVSFFRDYARTGIHAGAAALLTLFGLLANLAGHWAFIAVGIAIYLLPPVYLYLTRDGGESGEPGEPSGPGASAGERAPESNAEAGTNGSSAGARASDGVEPEPEPSPGTDGAGVRDDEPADPASGNADPDAGRSTARGVEAGGAGADDDRDAAPGADADADTGADSGSGADGGARVGSDSDTDTDGDRDADGDTDSDSNADADADADADVDFDSDADADGDSVVDADADGDSVVDADADSDSGVDGDADADADAGALDSDSDSDADGGVDTDTDGDDSPAGGAVDRESEPRGAAAGEGAGASEPEWTAAAVPTGATLRGVAVGADGVYAAGDGGVLLARRDDGWESVLDDGPSAQGETLRGVDVSDDGRAVWVAGDGGALAAYDVESGRHVDLSAPEDQTSTWNDVAVTGAAGEETVYLVNGSGAVLRGSRRNGGAEPDWGEPVKPGSGSGMTAIVAAADADRVVACDSNGSVFESTGGEFEAVGIDGADALHGAAATGETIEAVAADGRHHRRADGVWTPRLVAETTLRGVERRGELGIVVGDGGTVAVDGGGSWELADVESDATLRGVAIARRDAAVTASATVVGDGGVVLERR